MIIELNSIMAGFSVLRSGYLTAVGYNSGSGQWGVKSGGKRWLGLVLEIDSQAVPHY